MASVIRSGSYPLGSDLVWLAVDSAEHVAAFITGGEGPIPANLLDRNMLIDDDVEQRILNSPAVSPARLMKELGDPMSFAAIAERGIFVYDWTDVHRTTAEEVRAYELVAAPTHPLRIADLPDGLAAIAAVNLISSTHFATAIALDVCLSIRCVKAR